MGGQETTSAVWGGLDGREPQPCQGEGRGFESRRPLAVKHLISGHFEDAWAGGGSVAAPMVCPWFARGSPMVAVPFCDDWIIATTRL